MNKRGITLVEVLISSMIMTLIVGSFMETVNGILARSFADPEALTSQIAALHSGGAPLRDRVEFEFPRRLVCQRTVATVRGAEDEVLGQIVVYRDITTEAEAEASKSEFVSVVSHELRTPLTSVKTSLNLLARGAAGEISEGTQELLEIALRNIDRLIRLVDDLLDLSRIESGRVVTKLEPIAVAESSGSKAARPKISKSKRVSSATRKGKTSVRKPGREKKQREYPDWARKMSLDELRGVRGEIEAYIEGLRKKGIENPAQYEGALQKMEVVEDAMWEKENSQ